MLLRVSHLNRSFLTGFKGYRSVVSATMVKELRDKSGCPMMECKKALSAEGVNGDIALAMDWLRAKGIARASSNADRVAKEGLIALNTSPSGSMVLLEVNSETDFLSMNSDFQDFVVMVSNSIGSASLKGEVPVADILALKPVGSKSASHQTVQDSLGDVIASIRENIVLRRAEVLVNTTAGSVLSGYVHNKVGADRIPSHVQLGRAAAVVQLTVSNPALAEKVHTEVGRKLAMHTVAAKPAYLNAESVPSEVVERELAIFREQAAATNATAAQNKKPDVVEKIVQGKLSKRLGEIALLGQSHMAEEGGPVIKKHLEAYSKAAGAQVDVKRFALWSVGQVV